MDWGGARHRLLPLSLISALWLMSAPWALPACGLIVGFEARDLCDDCSLPSTSTGTTALGTNGGGGGSGGGASTAAVGTSGGGSNASGSGGSGASAGTSSSGGGGGTGGVAGGSGGMDTTSNGGAAGADATDPTPCRVDRSLVIEEAMRPFPAELAFSKSGAASFWRLGWLDGGALRFLSVDLAASSTTGDYSLAALVDLERSAPSIAANGSRVAIALGEAESGSARLSLHYVNALNPSTGPVVDSFPVTGTAAPQPGAVVPIGNTDRFLVAALTSDATGVLTLFDANQFESPLSLGASVTSISAAWLGQRGVAAYVAEGALLLAGLEIGEDGLGATAWGELVQAELASTTREHRIRAVAAGNRIALVWVGDDGTYLSTLDPAQGLESASAPLRVSRGRNDAFPAVTGHGDEIAVSWIDADGTLYFRRYRSLEPEQALEIATAVGSETFGFVSDPLESTSYYGLAFNGAGLEFSRISCAE